MTFDQADRLCTDIIDFLKECGGPYPTMDPAYLQKTVLLALASGQFVIRIDGKGIRYFACYWMLDAESMAAFNRNRTFPANIASGRQMYVAEVGSRGVPGDSRQLVRRLRDKEEKHVTGVFWHQPHRNNRECKALEKT